ncbi:MAG: HAMP domain-containing sensor histidine kinase [Leptolyngbyaceae cyanobacterium bins.349]|nr:HAMP domain-containing sensor histidine kinase [Leptolyngbyaceae cyanobacterium bins.349]
MIKNRIQFPFDARTALWVRLLTTHALVMLIGIMVILLIGSLYHVNLSDALVASIVSLTSLITISWLIGTKISRPLQRLERAMQLFQAGDLTVRVPPCSIPEIHQLGLSFNHLATSLQGVEQRRRELTSDLAHELRTPVTVIHGYLELLNTGKIPFNSTIGSQMSQETERIQRLVNNVLELSKLEAGYLPLHLQTLHPVPMLNHVISLFEAECLQANCQLRSHYPLNLPAVFADRDRLIQILVNLMNNAITYSPNSCITLRAWANASELWIAVTDTGTGISPADLPHIFDRFWQTEQARTLKIGSTGIGLAICKRLVELQGGRIEVESELRKGSTFRFCVPLEVGAE